MKKLLHPFRVTAALLVLYAAGHTFGALVQTPRFGVASDAVTAAMKSVHVAAQGSDCTWWGFYLGFGYNVTIFVLFSALLAWFLGGLSLAEQRRWAVVAWALCVSYALTLVLAVRYFFVAPIVFSTAITLLLAVQCVRLTRVPPAAG
jgi:hypothetical protein